MTQASRTADPDRLVLVRGEDGQLFCTGPGAGASNVRVRAVRCFPWSAPDGHVSLRDDDDEEVALIEDLAELDADGREALRQSLREAGLVLDVRGIDSIEEDFELRVWKVQTAQGPRTFQTPLDAWPRDAPNGGQLIEDVQGDVFRIPDPASLDPKSRKELWAFLD